MPDRAEVLLQGLRVRLQEWFPIIKRATGAMDVCWVPISDGAFTVNVTWMMKDRPHPYQHSTSFTHQKVFGESYKHSPQAWRVQRKACDYARDIIRSVLTERGVL